MITTQVSFRAAEFQATLSKLMTLRSSARRSVLRKAGTAATKEVLAAVKSGKIPVAAGVLKKSFRRKIKIYTASATVFGIVGTDAGIKEQVSKYKDYRTGRVRQWIHGQPKKGPKYQSPAKYIHLAGAGRKGRIIQDAQKATESKVKAIVLEVLQRELGLR